VGVATRKKEMTVMSYRHGRDRRRKQQPRFEGGFADMHVSLYGFGIVFFFLFEKWAILYT